MGGTHLQATSLYWIRQWQANDLMYRYVAELALRRDEQWFVVELCGGPLDGLLVPAMVDYGDEVTIDYGTRVLLYEVQEMMAVADFIEYRRMEAVL